MGKKKHNKSRNNKKCDEPNQSQNKLLEDAKNNDLHDNKKLGAASHSNTGASQSMKENSSNRTQSKNDHHNTYGGEKRPQHGCATSVMNVDQDDNKKLGASSHSNTGASQSMKENSSNGTQSKNDHHNKYGGEKRPQHGCATSVMIVDQDDNKKLGAASHSNTGTSQSMKGNSNKGTQSKNDHHNKYGGEKRPQHRFATSVMNVDQDDNKKLGAASHSDTGASQSMKENSSNGTQSKNYHHNKYGGEKRPQHRFATSVMNVDQDDEEAHKLDYAGAVADDNIGVATDTEMKHIKDYGKNKEPHNVLSTNELNAELDERGINGRKSKFDQQPNRKEFKKSVVSEVKGDLFCAPKEYSLAHCVAADMRMGSGIATTFKQMFKNVKELLGQKKRVGDVAVLHIEEENRFIYYLVTKAVSNGKPSIHDLERSLLKMKKHIVENNVHKLAMPRIGCGLDRLEWSEVFPKIERIFHDIDIEIVVYDFSQTQDEETTKQLYKSSERKVYIYNKIMKLVDIQCGTGYIFIGTEDGFVDSTINSLDSKFNILQDYKRANRKLGEVIKIERKDYFYGLIAKKRGTDDISYNELGNCLIKLRKMLQKDKYEYVGFEAFFDDNDLIATNKVITLFENYLNIYLYVWVCWPQEVILKIPDGFLPKFS